MNTETKPVEANIVVEKLASLELQADALNVQIGEAKQELAAAMNQERMKEIVASTGQGYRMQRKQTTSFSSEALDYLDAEGITHLFQAEPKITATAIESLRKAGALEDHQLNTLNLFKKTETSGELAITKFTPKLTKAYADSEIARVKQGAPGTPRF